MESDDERIFHLGVEKLRNDKRHFSHYTQDDFRYITIHSYAWGPCAPEEFEWYDLTTSIYYLPDIESDRYEPEQNHSFKAGYIIEAKIKAVANPKIEYITKAYFNKIYKELNNINFELLAKYNEMGCDGGELEVKIGTDRYAKEISLWSPHENDNLESAKLLKLMDKIEKKIGFNKWYYELMQNGRKE